MLNERQWEIMNKKQKNAKHKKPNLKKGLYELSERYKNADKSSLISAMTGGVFVLLALIQLFFVLFTPIAQTFDHVSLILVDFIIAALCFVYVLYRRGSLGDGFGFLHTDGEEKAAENIPQATSKAAKTAKTVETEKTVEAVKTEDAGRTCAVAGLCGGCGYSGVPYDTQLKKKQDYIEGLLSPFGKVLPIIGMEELKEMISKG